MWPSIYHPTQTPYGIIQTGNITISSGYCGIEPFSIKEPELKCICDIMALMAVGCKCGQFEREKKAK